MNVALHFPSIYDHVICAAHEIRKQCGVEARVLSNAFVFLIPVLYLPVSVYITYMYFL